ncbi:MAG TPA: hypothetical protein VF875_07730, partial [Anaeromyxobacter sp.]
MRPLSTRALAAVAIAAAAATFGFSLLRVWDPDAFHHLAMGRHLARHGLVAEEPFLFPLRGAGGGPVPYWLGSLAIYGAYRVAGEAALQLLPALVGAALAVVLLLDAAPRGGRHTPISVAAAAPALALALLGFRYRAVARPELFANLLLAVSMWAVRRFEDGRPRLLWAFPALALAWTNLHPSVVAGLGVVALLAGIAVLRSGASRLRAGTTDPTLRREAVLATALAAGGGLAATVSPSPGATLASALRFAAAHYLPSVASPEMIRYDQNVLRGIPEMQPLQPRFWIEPFGLLLVLTAVAVLWAWAATRRPPRAREVLTVAAFAALASG